MVVPIGSIYYLLLRGKGKDEMPQPTGRGRNNTRNTLIGLAAIFAVGGALVARSYFGSWKEMYNTERDSITKSADKWNLTSQ